MPKRKVTNRDIARILKEIAAIYEAEGVQFKPQAYEIAAKTVEELGEELSSMYRECGRGCIDDLPGIGKSITELVEELVTLGRSELFEKMKRKYPFDILALTAIEGVGPKTVVELYRRLKIKTVADLERAIKAGKIEKLSGFGKRSQEKMLEGISFLKKGRGRVLLNFALYHAEQIEERMRAVEGVSKFDVCGSVRRRKETIGDLDFIVATKKPKKAIEAFKNLPFVEKVVEEGQAQVAVKFTFGMDGDLLVINPAVYGAALVHFTGSKEHNIQIRSLAIDKGLKLSEYGIKKGKKVLAGKNEDEVYRRLGMKTPPPEIREARGEVEVALQGKLPALIPYGSIKGDLQIQTDWSDGHDSIEDMAQAARDLGLEYIAITDHTKSLAMTGGLNETDLARQAREIDKVNKKMRGFKVLKSSEVEILKDGKLDLSDAALERLDIVSVAVHSNFGMSEEEMTERIIRAMKNPLVNILFHPTGRVINKRPGYKIDMSKIVEAAKEYKVALEANAFPDRLDLNDAHIRMAVDAGVKLVINTDAHSTEHLKYLDLGVAQARRGWARKADVLNALSVDMLEKKLSQKKQRI
ncbi:MAG: DNA polymerase/3'-5' exonuclease PolX [bacterium]